MISSMAVGVRIPILLTLMIPLDCRRGSVVISMISLLSLTYSFSLWWQQYWFLILCGFGTVMDHWLHHGKQFTVQSNGRTKTFCWRTTTYYCSDGSRHSPWWDVCSNVSVSWSGGWCSQMHLLDGPIIGCRIRKRTFQRAWSSNQSKIRRTNGFARRGSNVLIDKSVRFLSSAAFVFVPCF